MNIIDDKFITHSSKYIFKYITPNKKTIKYDIHNDNDIDNIFIKNDIDNIIDLYEYNKYAKVRLQFNIDDINDYIRDVIQIIINLLDIHDDIIYYTKNKNIIVFPYIFLDKQYYNTIKKRLKRKLNISYNIEYTIYELYSKLFIFYEYDIVKNTIKKIDSLNSKSISIYYNINNKQNIYFIICNKYDDTSSCSEQVINIDYEFIKKLLNILSPKKNIALKELGQCIFNITNGSKKGKELFIKLSNDNDTKYKKIWNSISNSTNNLDIKILKLWAKNDDNDRYNDIIDERSTMKAMDVIDFKSDKKYAEVLYEICGDIFIYYTHDGIHKKKTGWYEFNNIWTKCDKMEIKKIISGRLLNVFQKVYHLINPAQKNRIKALMSIIKDLESTTMKNKILVESEELFYNKYFGERLNTTKTLFAVMNGVLDLDNIYIKKKGNFNHYFREGRQTDYISLCSGCNYIDFDKTTKDIDFDNLDGIKEQLNKLFVLKEKRDYVLDLIASCLIGSNVNKIFPIFIGSGDNGKSLFIDKYLFNVFGTYFGKISISEITNKKGRSNEVNPQMVRLVGKRAVFTQESNSGDELNAGTIKELTGNDSVALRTLYDEGGDYEFQFTLGLVTNNEPKIPPSETAIFNRILYIKFQSIFEKNENSDNVPDDINEQYNKHLFIADVSLNDTFKELLPAFLWILLDHLKKYKENDYKLNPPQCILNDTLEYRKNIDIYENYISDTLEKSENDKISILSLWTSYKKWYNDSYPKSKCPTKTDFKENIKKRVTKKLSKDYLHGYILKMDKNDISDNEDEIN